MRERAEVYASDQVLLGGSRLLGDWRPSIGTRPSWSLLRESDPDNGSAYEASPVVSDGGNNARQFRRTTSSTGQVRVHDPAWKCTRTYLG